jgi:hypothetical protein
LGNLQEKKGGGLPDPPPVSRDEKFENPVTVSRFTRPAHHNPHESLM